MAKILIDTSIIIDFLRQNDKPKTILYNLSRDKHKLYTSIITHTESYAGKSVWEKEDARLTLKTLFSSIQIISLEENISEKAGQISALYNIDILDSIIAATAIIYKLKLVTLNIKDFEKIDQINLFVKRGYFKSTL